MRFSRTRAAMKLPGPQIGEHNEYVLREVLGLSLAEIAELAERSALERSTRRAGYTLLPRD